MSRIVTGVAACAFDAEPERWVPDIEDRTVPPHLAALCRGCPLRAGCLEFAVLADQSGYWAGTTTKQRRRLATAGEVSMAAADELTQRDTVREQPIHAEGRGSTHYYRRGRCRCTECRSHNAASRAGERARRTIRTAA